MYLMDSSQSNKNWMINNLILNQYLDFNKIVPLILKVFKISSEVWFNQKIIYGSQHQWLITKYLFLLKILLNLETIN